MPHSVSLNEQPIDLGAPSLRVDHGAALEFLGVVREMENGRPLLGLRYSCYEPMAQALLPKIMAEAEAKFGPHELRLHHRLGFVAVAEPSVLIRVSAGHSREAFGLCEYYLAAVKKTLPIWKEPVYAGGSAAA